MSLRSVIRSLRAPGDDTADTDTAAPAAPESASPESPEVINYSARVGDLPNGIPEPSTPTHVSDGPAGAAGQG